MADSATRSAGAPDPAPDFSSLRARGIGLLQRLAGQTWTDHNTHDPGITILEQLCYALTDLDYRARYDVPDLLSRDGKDPYASLYTPAQILPSRPVTLADLRRVVIDVSGVKNAWVDLVDAPVATFDSAHHEVSHLAPTGPGGWAPAPSPNVSEIRVRGLYRVRIEKSELVDRDGGAIRRDVARRLHRHRGLGEDFQGIEVLDPQPIRVVATLEVAAATNATELLARVYQALAEHISPTVPFHTLDEMLARGRRVDEIFEGPLLDHGFIDPDELESCARRATLRRSDLVHVLMTVPGVVAVKRLNFLTPTGTLSDDWLLDVDPDRAPRFELRADDIHLERRDLRVDAGLQDDARQLFTARFVGKAADSLPTTGQLNDLRPVPGRDRRIAHYLSVQEQFPVAYGIGSAGLSPSAPPERRAQAKQLQAYLTFFDQLLANQFAQVAGAATLVSFDDTTSDSYFSQVLSDDVAPGMNDIRLFGVDVHAGRLRRISEDPWQRNGPGEAPNVLRRDRFLDHLLARFGEQLSDFALAQSAGGASDDTTRGERIARSKRAFLHAYARLSRDRGVAFDYLAPPGDDNLSGLERVLRHKLGISDPAERFHLVEHILLRPIEGDMYQRGPLLRAVQLRDPYSLQISLVFPGSAGRYPDPAFRKLVERTVREETPAHLTAYVLWKDDASAFQAFASAHATWLERLPGSRLSEVG
jgi:hypothetical protein